MDLWKFLLIQVFIIGLLGTGKFYTFDFFYVHIFGFLVLLNRFKVADTNMHNNIPNGDTESELLYQLD